jgi:hypothetical protein
MPCQFSIDLLHILITAHPSNHVTKVRNDAAYRVNLPVNLASQICSIKSEIEEINYEDHQKPN